MSHRAAWVKSGLRSEYLTYTYSWMSCVPNARAQVPPDTLRFSKWARKRRPASRRLEPRRGWQLGDPVWDWPVGVTSSSGAVWPYGRVVALGLARGVVIAGIGPGPGLGWLVNVVLKQPAKAGAGGAGQDAAQPGGDQLEPLGAGRRR